MKGFKLLDIFGPRLRLATIAATLSFGTQAGVLAAVVHAEGCLNEQIRLQEGYGVSLPDCRAYEQVSPTDKNFADALGAVGAVQTSPTGGAVTFFSLAPFGGIMSAPGDALLYLSTFQGDGWSTQGLLPRFGPGSFEPSVVGWTEDISHAVVEAQELPLAEGVTPGVNSYLRDNATGSYELLPGSLQVADATPDNSRIIFDDGLTGFYVWNKGQLRLLVPGAAAGGGVTGKNGEGIQRYSQNAISQDGSGVFFTDLHTNRVYLREIETETTIPVSAGPAVWRTATPDGRYALYTEEGRLYRFSIEGGNSEELTENIAGTLGISNDGSYVYFVDGGARLYEWHEGATTLVAGLNPLTDEADWRGFPSFGLSEVADENEQSSRVTPDGKTVLFSSTNQLTSYANPAHHIELYLFSAPSDRLTCVSCNPLGDGVTSSAYLARDNSVIRPNLLNPFVTRNLSEEGNRVFFQTEEALVSQDTNGQMDVYEWEREGAGSCANGVAMGSGGCLYLISTGRSAGESYFGDASADGSSVFFFTRQPLVVQDQDNNADVYDARVDGGVAAQSAVPTPPCASEACHGTPPPPPAMGTPSSSTFSGSGNLSPQPEAATVVKVKANVTKKRPKAKKKPTKKKGKKAGVRRKAGRS